MPAARTHNHAPTGWFTQPTLGPVYIPHGSGSRANHARGSVPSPLISGLPEEPDPRRQRYRSLVTVILVVLSAASVVAQEFRTSIRGHVLDSSKGALSRSCGPDPTR
jgi:hypothetical protein